MPRPGWYPGSTLSVPLLRFWDGARWTPQTRLVDSDPGGGGAKPPRKRRWWQAVKWGAVGAFVLAAAVIGVALARGQQVCSVNTQGEFVFVTKDEQCVPKAELAKAQEGLNGELAAPKAEAAALPVPSTLPDLNGRWAALGGITYVITQGGSNATIEEFVPGFGFTANGVGTVTEQGAQFAFQAFNGSTGYGDYMLREPGVLVGTVTNVTLNAVTSVVLTRVG
ncbi:hypothetical protein DDP54_09000 [Cellulomonas sp. WB94]|nr:hypothetical protein DDP54_09000 [Cellulomonas sp. WB94]